ncbi:hypothetical protein [Halobacillus sp. Marseille-Q1614]|uniref:hypothetical protein n=1 Tax=Halobacillus sp. Marseille-Q1614 TaxID=2709134 RepID=UPI0015715D76|nr:hypothetical protein [Halobacillus sp. Marseille-Q1614]
MKKKKDNLFTRRNWQHPSRQKSLHQKHSDNSPDDFHPDYSQIEIIENLESSDENKIYTPFKSRGKAPRPVILSPPKLENQIVKGTQQEEADDRIHERTASSPNHKENGTKRLRTTSSFRKEFSSMLEDSYSPTESEYYIESSSSLPLEEKEEEVDVSEDHIESQSKEQLTLRNSLKEEFISLLIGSPLSEEDLLDTEEQSIANEEDPSSDNYKYSILKDIVSSMEVEPAEEQNRFKNYYFSQKDLIDVEDEESLSFIDSVDGIESFTEEESSSINEPSSERESNESFSLISESSSLADDSYESLIEKAVCEEEEISSSVEHDIEPSLIIEDLMESSDDPTIDDESSVDYEEEDDESPLSNVFEKELEDKECNENDQREHLPYAVTKKKENNFLVKVPVLLSKVLIDIDIMESLDMIDDLSEVIKIDWSLYSLKVNVLSTTSNAFFSGVFLADVEYVSDPQKRTIHTVKIPIQWDKAVKVNWLLPPELANSYQKDYNFASPYAQEGSTHYEYYQEFTNPIEKQVQSIHFIWHNSTYSKAANERVSIQGNAQICIDLLQKQYITY